MARQHELIEQVGRRFPEGVSQVEPIITYLCELGYKQITTSSDNRTYILEGNGSRVELTRTRLWRENSPEAVRIVVKSPLGNGASLIAYASETFALPPIEIRDAQYEWPPNVGGRFEN